MAKSNFNPQYLGDPNEAVEQEWIWFRRIPRGLVTLLSGVGGVGKTKTIANIVATMFHQEEFIDGTFPGTDRGHVLVLTTENDANMLAKDFAAQGCTVEEDWPFIHVLNYIKKQGYEEEFAFDIDLELEALTAQLDKWHPVMLVIDPLREFHSRKDNDSLQIRLLMMKLNQIAKKYNVAILGVIHWNKDQKMSREARMSGSHQYRDGSRSVIIIEQDNKDKRLRHFIQDKMNIEQEPDDLSFTIEPPKGLVTWTPVEGVNAPTQVQECKEWLMELLSEGPKTVKELTDGEVFNERTVFRARKELGQLVVKTSKFLEYKYVEYWELASHDNHWGMKL